MTSRLAVRIAAPLLSLAVCLLVAAPAASAVNPHSGTFPATTDACAACHRAHTAAGETLLKTSSQNALCLSCHDGAGADTNVDSGLYLGTTAGTQNAGLRGGGFQQALMNTAALPLGDGSGDPPTTFDMMSPQARSPPGVQEPSAPGTGRRWPWSAATATTPTVTRATVSSGQGPLRCPGGPVSRRWPSPREGPRHTR